MHYRRAIKRDEEKGVYKFELQYVFWPLGAAISYTLGLYVNLSLITFDQQQYQ